MFLGYGENNTGGTYRMLNLCTKRIVLSCDIIWINKIYREYVSRKVNTKPDTYIIQDEDKSYNWDHVKIDPIKNDGKTENVKTEENVSTNHNYRGEEDTYKTIKVVYLSKQEKSIKTRSS